MPIKTTPTHIPDVVIVEPKVFEDNRGFFFESFNQNELNQALNKEVTFVQDNHSMSKKGVLRGLHYQLEHTQGKLVRVTKGAVFDVAVDLRKSSSTYAKWVGVELSAENKKQLWIPEGFAHGFLAMSDEVEFFYKTTDYYHFESERCILWSDKVLSIMWPDLNIDYIVGIKDQLGLDWYSAEKFS